MIGSDNTIGANIYTGFKAITESAKCLMCDDAPCQEGCPAKVKISLFLRQIRTGDFIGAAKTIREDNVFGSTCARICPSQRLCQKNCNSSKIGMPIDIPGLQEFVCDMHLKAGLKPVNQPNQLNKSIAIVGAGPGGLAAAFELRKLGYQVTIFERQKEIGGMLKLCLPDYRLPRDILDSEISFITDYGVKIIFEKDIIKVKELQNKFDAVYLSVGLQYDLCLDIPGNNLDGVMTALNFLTNKYVNNSIKLGKNVAVIGGGDVAMDCARTAIRYPNVENVYLIYRRSAKEMPAQPIEKDQAEKEGIIFHNLLAPTSIEGNNVVQKLNCIQTVLAKPDSSGRRSPVVVDNTLVTFDVDNVIFAIGQQPSNEFILNNPDLKTNKKGLLEIDSETFETTVRGVFAGGDIVGTTTAIESIGNAKKAAYSIHSYLSGSN